MPHRKSDLNYLDRWMFMARAAPAFSLGVVVGAAERFRFHTLACWW